MRPVLLLPVFFVAFSVWASKPDLQLANVYQDHINLENYWVSEKYDGVRAYWNGLQLLSRAGNIIHAPSWFTADLPLEPLDGELWLARGQFDQLSGIIRRQTPVDEDWSNVQYLVFDLPDSQLIFDQRLQRLEAIIGKIDTAFVRLVKQEKIFNQALLMQKLDEVVAYGGEGLMLHLGSSTYKKFRSNDLLKLKRYSDAEAVVLKHLPGKGKFEGMIGSMLVETLEGKRFKIGTGFSDAQRRNPPPIGSVITYKYFGLTSKGIPRFASFLRIRKSY